MCSCDYTISLSCTKAVIFPYDMIAAVVSSTMITDKHKDYVYCNGNKCMIFTGLVSEDVNLYCEILVNSAKINTVIVLVRLTEKYQIRLSVSQQLNLCFFFSL